MEHLSGLRPALGRSIASPGWMDPLEFNEPRYRT